MDNQYVYLAGPYTLGDPTTNVQNMIEAAEAIIAADCIPYVPLLDHFWNTVYPHSYEFWVQKNLAWIDRCDLVVRLPGKSKGADLECKYAHSIGKPVELYNDFIQKRCGNG